MELDVPFSSSTLTTTDFHRMSKCGRAARLFLVAVASLLLFALQLRSLIFFREPAQIFPEQLANPTLVFRCRVGSFNDGVDCLTSRDMLIIAFRHGVAVFKDVIFVKRKVELAEVAKGSRQLLPYSRLCEMNNGGCEQCGGSLS